MGYVPFFPTSASSIAGHIDGIYFVWLVITGLAAIAVSALIVLFSVQYRAGSAVSRSTTDPERYRRTAHHIEIAWIVAPLVLFLAMFAWSAEVFYWRSEVPPNALPVYVVGKQWMWHLEHPGGQREIDELHIPVGRPVELLMTSQDVIHSFSVPDFRVKQDVLPSAYTTLWFTATHAGEYHLFCTQYCGTAHSRMVGRVIAMEPSAYARWLSANAGPQTMAGRGEVLYREFGCSGCHEPNSTVHAPVLAGLFDKPVPLKDGRSVTADERYIHDKILMPNRDIPAGYEPTMPSYRGQMSEEQLLEIVEYIKSIGGAAE